MGRTSSSALRLCRPSSVLGLVQPCLGLVFALDACGVHWQGPDTNFRRELSNFCLKSRTLQEIHVIAQDLSWNAVIVLWLMLRPTRRLAAVCDRHEAGHRRTNRQVD